MTVGSFTTKDLILAMVPIDIVLKQFDQEHGLTHQRQFVSLLKLAREKNSCKYYLSRLAKTQVSNLEATNVEFSDELMQLMAELCSTSHQQEEVRVSFEMFNISLRVFTKDNLVGLQRVWEAGACLAEYLVDNRTLIENKRVVELGAGIGLTGAVAGHLGAKHVQMTDCHQAILENLRHNIQLNQAYNNLSTAFYEFGTNDKSITSNADVLLAADVAYDSKLVPSLVRTLDLFFGNEKSSPIALFATTFRSQATFDTLERGLRQRLVCEYQDIKDIPYLFPCYFVQPRSDVKICLIRQRLAHSK